MEGKKALRRSTEIGREERWKIWVAIQLTHNGNV
jgi:hypothetical protein